MDNTGVRTLPREKLLLAKAPNAELAGAALEATAAAELEPGAAALIVVAVPPRLVAEAEELILEALARPGE